MYILCCNRIKKAEPRFAMFFQATDGRFKKFCTVLKTRISLEVSRLEGSRDEKGISKVLHARSKVKEFFNFFQIQEI